MRVCPRPAIWALLHEGLVKHAAACVCAPAVPPAPLILSGWIYSTDRQKQARWAETVAWANANGAAALLAGLRSSDYYEVERFDDGEIGPAGGLMYLSWSFETKVRPPQTVLVAALQRLRDDWLQIATPEMAAATSPLDFTGAKARRLLVEVDVNYIPPWGGWTWLAPDSERRRTFTRFRTAVNAAVAPHHIDHIGFEPSRLTTEERSA